MNPEAGKSAALVNLTATYTDSEGEEGSGSDEENSGEPFDAKSLSRDSTPTLLLFPEGVSGLRSGLVSYLSGEGPEEDDEDAVKIVDSSYSDTEVLEKSRTGEPLQRPLSPTSYHRSLVSSGSQREIQLPAESPGRCSNALQEKFAKLYEKKTKDRKNMNETIQMRKDFRNPSIYEKLVSYCNIDEKGTNYPPEFYDPHSWGPESFYDELAKRQKEEMDKREKERKDRTKVEFISGTVKKQVDANAAAAAAAAAAAKEVARRTSKWDMGVGGGQVLGTSSIKPATLITPNVVLSATGTKPTIISAFGTITKKGKQ